MTTLRQLANDLGQFLHPEHHCAGEPCTFHNPTEHKMRDWPVILRASALIERVCEHGTGHPDPDSAWWKNKQMGHEPGTWETHGCDGCCHEDGYQWFTADWCVDETCTEVKKHSAGLCRWPS